MSPNKKYRRYNLKCSYEITATDVTEFEDGNIDERWTNERLTIEDKFDLQKAMELTKVLSILDGIHTVIREAVETTRVN